MVKQSVSISIEPELLSKIDSIVERSNNWVSRSHFISFLIEKYLNNNLEAEE